MSLFEFCLEIINRESARFNVGVNPKNASQITAATASEISFDIAHNRCAYLYRCGTITLTLAMECFSKFLSEHKSFGSLLYKWVKSSELTVCSLSKGPALDYIGLFLSHHKAFKELPFLFKNVKVISKYGAWRNTVNIMLEILNGGYFQSISPTMPIGNIEVIQGDPFENLTDKIKQPISEADIVLMMKTLNLQADGYDQEKVAKSLQDFLGSLKPGAIIFCIDTKPSISVMTRELASIGNFLFEPTFINTAINIEFVDFYKDIFGCTPVSSARGSFFVWEKSSVAMPNIDYLIDKVSEAVKLLDIKSVDEHNGKLLTDRQHSEQSMTDNVLLASSDSSENDSMLSKKNLHLKEAKYIIDEHKSRTNASFENLDNDRASNSSQTIFQDYYCMKQKKENVLLTDFISVDETVQTESEDSSQGNASKIVELTNRIAKLTTTLSDMLETSESSIYSNDGCQCRNPLTAKAECCMTASNCCQINPCHQGYSVPKCCNSNVSLVSACKNSKHCRSCDHMLNSLPDDDLNKSPKLVIPLNNLSGDVASKIISLLSSQSEK